MKTLLGVIALVSALVGLTALTGPAAAIEPPDPDCPQALGGFPWIRVAVGNPNQRLADRNRDGVACTLAVTVRGRTVLTLDTDNAIGDPNVFPPDPCTSPFAPLRIGADSSLAPLDLNRDGTLCVFADLAAPALVLVDNPNSIPERSS